MTTFSSNKPYLIRALREWISDNQGTPHLVVNTEFNGVEVPQEFVSDGEIVLNVSETAVQQLELGNEWISFNARFSGSPRRLVFPVAAVLAIVARENGQGMAFPPEAYAESAPETDSNSDDELSVEQDASQKKSNTQKIETGRDTSRSHLKIIK